MGEIEIDNGGKSSTKLGISHLATAGGVVLAIMMLQPVKDFFYTREEGRSAELRIDKVEKAIEILSKELRDAQTSNTDRMMTALATQDARMESRFTSLENSLNRNIELLLRNQKQGENNGQHY